MSPRHSFAGDQQTARVPIAEEGEATLTVHVPMTFRRRRGHKALLSKGGGAVTLARGQRVPAHSAIVRALARAFRWRRLIEGGVHTTVHDIAAAERINPSYVSRVLRLTVLAPEIV